jgi:hypothetical protein
MTEDEEKEIILKRTKSVTDSTKEFILVMYFSTFVGGDNKE